MTLTAAALVFLAVACAFLGGMALALRQKLDRLQESTRAALAEAADEVVGLEQGREDLERLSAIDPLTGVWNYRHLQGTLARELEGARTAGAGGALLMIDVDDFRRVNAAHGHQRGSAVLRELAQRLALEVRTADTFARYGGEEFVLILPGERRHRRQGRRAPLLRGPQDSLRHRPGQRSSAGRAPAHHLHRRRDISGPRHPCDDAFASS